MAFQADAFQNDGFQAEVVSVSGEIASVLPALRTAAVGELPVEAQPILFTGPRTEVRGEAASVLPALRTMIEADVNDDSLLLLAML